MTLVVDLGLERFYYNDADARQAAVASLVENGYTTLAHEIVSGPRDDPHSAKVLAAYRRADEVVVRRWLDASERKPILADLVKVCEKHGSYASFSWAELEEIGAYDVQPLALVLDGPRGPPRDGIALPGVSACLRAVSLERSLVNWSARHPQARAAAALHKLARKHRLVIHCA
jgi:hypothetical protein